MFWYNFGISCWIIVLRIVSPFNTKANKMLAGRKAGLKPFIQDFAQNDLPVVWFHCASLGEFELSRPIIELYRKEYGNAIKILITFYSPSGYEVRKDYSLADFVHYLPFDQPKLIHELVTIVKPALVFFAKYDFWIHLISNLHQLHVPMVAFSCSFRKNQFYFKKSGQFYLNVLKKIDHFFVIDTNSETLLKTFGIVQVTSAGDTRFDKVLATSKTRESNEIAATFKDDCLLFIAGSVWPEDIDILLPLFNNPNFEAKVILAPHEINQKEINKLTKKFKRTPLLYSQATNACLPCHDVLIIDNVGLLASLYQYADVAYVGGAFKQGLHNILEPAVFGIPIVFGPNIENFVEAKALVTLNGSFSVKNTNELQHVYFNSLVDPIKRREFGKACDQYVADNVGAAHRIFDFTYHRLAPQQLKN